jgi:hypothetical protein
MSPDEVRGKFAALAARAVPATQADRIAALVDRLDRLGDVTELVEACAFRGD